MTKPITNPLHLYRSLLRETTYLFDADVRTFCHTYISSSFRQHAIPDAAKRATSPSPSLSSQTGTHKLKRGRKFLYMLERVNYGHVHAVEKVLELTYGRRGKRRRQLMSEIMNSQLADPMVEGDGRAVDLKNPNWRPSESFMTLARAQSRVQSTLTRSLQVKLSAAIPEKNRWGRPMPKRRIRNLNKKWYARTAGRLLPPLPESEWQEIYDKALGHKKMGEYAHRSRRHQGSVGVLTQAIEPNDAEAENIAEMLVRGVPKTPSITTKPARVDTSSQGKRGQNPHKMTPRFLRRRMARAVLRYTPVARARKDGKSLAFRWEEGVRNPKLPKEVTQFQLNSLFD